MALAQSWGWGGKTSEAKEIPGQAGDDLGKAGDDMYSVITGLTGNLYEDD